MPNTNNISRDTPISFKQPLIKTSSTIDVRPIHPHEVSGNNLNEYLSSRNELNHDEKIILLKRITLCLERLHQEHIVCQPLSPSSIYLENIIGSLAEKFKLNTSSNDIDKRNHSRALSDLFCYVLTNGKHEAYKKELVLDDSVCSDAYTAQNLITLLRKDIPPDTDVVFKHPFYWSDFGKAKFICNAVEFLLMEQNESENFDLKNYNMHDLNYVYFKEETTMWKNKLILEKSDIRRITDGEEHPPPENGIGPVPPSNNIIYYLARYYERDNILSLLRFFRNYFVHYYNNTLDVKAAFGSYPSGYLRFFTSRYPKMFMHVYENMKEYIIPEIDSGENKFSSSSVNIVCYTV